MDLENLSDAELEHIAGGGLRKESPDQMELMSDADLEKIANGGLRAQESEKIPAYVSAIRKLTQGATAGFSDEIAGAGEAIGRSVGLKGLGGPMNEIERAEGGPTLNLEVLKKAYEQGRNYERELLIQDSKDNPGISTVAEIGGAILSPVNKIAKGASLLKQGAAIGGITGLGNSEAEDAKGMLVDTATGAAIGGTVGKVADKASKVIGNSAKAVSKKSGDLAESFAARAVGAERATIKKLGKDTVKEVGRYALDEKLLTPLSSTDDVIARNAANKAKGGAKMDEVYSAIDDAGASTFNPLDVASKLDEKLGGFYRSPINQGETRQLENTLESILMRGDKNVSLKEAQVLKQELGKVANWKNNLNITDKEKMAREAYGIVNQSIDEATEAGAKSINRLGLDKTLKTGKKLYGNASNAEQLLTNKGAREQGNQLFGITDAVTATGAGGYAAVTGDLVTAGVAMLAKKGLQRFGSQSAALTLDKISKTLATSPKFAQLQSQNPKAFQALVQKLSNEANGPGSVLSKPGKSDNEKPDQEESRPLKGSEKWANDGVEKLKSHDKSGALSNPKVIEKIMNSKEGKSLLIAASDLKPNSKAMDQLLAKIKSKYIQEKL